MVFRGGTDGLAGHQTDLAGVAGGEGEVAAQVADSQRGTGGDAFFNQFLGELVPVAEQAADFLAPDDNRSAFPPAAAHGAAEGSADEDEENQTDDASGADAGGGGGFRPATEHEVIYQLAQSPEDDEHRPVEGDGGPGIELGREVGIEEEPADGDQQQRAEN